MKIVVVVMCCLLTIIGHVSSQNCISHGFHGCECNILGACDQNGIPITGLDDKFTGYAPIGVEQFHYAKGAQALPNLAYLCEKNFFTIMYDCNARIPLYAAIMVNNVQLHGAYNRPGNTNFKQSGTLDANYQQGPADYTSLNLRQACYENVGKQYLTEQSWYQEKNGEVGKPNCLENNPANVLAKMSKGHLIASRYGKGVPEKTLATYTFTNAVPQFESFNNNEWKHSEHYLIDTWGPKICGPPEHLNAKLFIVVGAIPSTFQDITNPRFFGKSGFSNFQGMSQLRDTYKQGSGGTEYRANVPRYMWTAACCTYQYLNEQKQMVDGIDNIAFYRSNDPGNKQCITTTPAKMITELKKLFPGMADIQPFPKNPKCMGSP